MSATRPHGAIIVPISGAIDHAFDWGRLLDVEHGSLVFDLDKVERITSAGVRTWLRGLERLRAEYCCFIRCRPLIVSQFNVVRDFAGPGQLVSLYLPYRCADCNYLFELLTDLRQQYATVAAFSIPAAKCPLCNGLAPFEDLPEVYLAYAASAGRPSPPAHVSAVIDGYTAGAQFRIDKSVPDAFVVLSLSGPLDDRAYFRRIKEGLDGRVMIRMNGVSGANRTGAERLRELVRTDEFSSVLVEVPAAVVDFLVEADLAGRIGSVVIPHRCSACSVTHQVRVDHDRRPPLRDECPCPQCGSAMSTGLAPELLDRLEALSFSDVPRDMTEYLEATSLERTADGTDVAGEPFGRYELVRLLGSGGMAEVFLGRQRGPGGFQKTVAVKRMLPDLSLIPRFVEMFLQEARIAARLDHPNIVQTFDFGRLGPSYFIVMEYVAGTTLNVVLYLVERLGVWMPIRLACAIVRDICSGLAAAHAHVEEHGRTAPVVHRDVSPHNVLLSRAGLVKITDFGVAKAAGLPELTGIGQFKGKIAYAAPERLGELSTALDPRIDVFSAGVILYECVARSRLFYRDSEGETVRAILRDPVPPLSQTRDDVPPGLDAIVTRAIALDPDQRYQTANELRQALDELIRKLPESEHLSDLAPWLEHLFERAREAGLVTEERGGFPEVVEDDLSGGAEGERTVRSNLAGLQRRLGKHDS